MIRRSLIVVAVIAAVSVAALAPASVAGAQQYPPGTCFLTVSDTTVSPGRRSRSAGR